MARRLRSKKRSTSRQNLHRHETLLRKKGFSSICGVDEAGRGPLAGPVVAAAVILRKRDFRSRIDDSKKLTATMRKRALAEIIKNAIVGIGIVSEKVIDRINILRATALAMEQAIKGLGVPPDYILIDGRVPVKSSYRKENIIKGDSKCISIACASIVAKVTRDNIMIRLHKKYPEYGFERHKGYGTRHHIIAIRKYGHSPVHRKTFKIGEGAYA